MEGSETAAGLSHAEAAEHCLVLAPPGGRVPAALVRALARHGLDAAVVPDEPGVMLHLVSARPRALIVVSRDRVGHLRELAGAVRRYYPRVALWRLVETATGPRLEALADHDGEAGVSDEAASPRASTGMRAGDAGVDRAAAHAAPRGDSGSASDDSAQQGPSATPEIEPATVTEAELAMLLKDSGSATGSEGQEP